MGGAAATLLACMALAACIAPHDTHGQEQDGPAPGYEIYVPDMMIRGESYRGLVVSNLPADGPATFRFGSAAGDIMLPDSAVLEGGRNHVLFDILPVQSTILSGVVSTGITVIPPDGEIREIPVETHPGVGVVSRLWIVGPGSGGVVCDDPGTATAQDIASRAADGVFDEPDPGKEIRTRLPQTTIHVFLADRYCTPVTAPPGGVSFAASSDTPALTFGGGRSHISGVIPQGFNSAVLDVHVGEAGGGGIIYATARGVSPDSIRVENRPVEVEVRLGVGPSVAMESSYVTWHLWLERDGEQYVPPGPVSAYLTTDNPVLASFDQALVDAGGPALRPVRPHHAFLLNGVASGTIHTGTPAVVGDLRLLSVDRGITVRAHVEGIGSATASFQIGAPGSFGEEFRVDTDRIRECMKEAGTLPDGFYSQDCNEMWHRLLVASHFFDITDPSGDPLDSEADTIAFLDGLFGGDNAESGAALYRLADRINEHSISDQATGGLAGDLTELLGAYLRTSEIDVIPVESLGVTAEMIERLPDDPPPNRLVLEAFPGRPGTANVVVSTMFGDGSHRFPVYLPDGIMTLSSDSGLSHPPEVRTYGSVPRPDAPGTRPSAMVVPVAVHGGGAFTASLGGVGGGSVQIQDMAPAGGKRLHVSTLPGGGERDLIAIISVLDSDGLLTSHSGDVHVEAGQGASGVELVGWRGGGGMVRGSVDGVGEIIVHAPGIGGGTALTTPMRHEAELAVWHPGRVHVAEEFPLSAHALDSAGLPIRKVPVEVSGAVAAAGSGLKLTGNGGVPIVVEYGGMFHGGVVDGFLNRAGGAGAAVAADVVELHDTVEVLVDSGAMPEPAVSVAADGLLFSGEGGRWNAAAAAPGTYAIDVHISKPGWEPYSARLPVRVAHLIDVTYDAATTPGQRVDADLALCGETVLPGDQRRLEPGLCTVSVPEEISVGGVAHRLDSLTVNGLEIQPGATAVLDSDAGVLATYRGVVTVEAVAAMPDGTTTELLWGRYQPGDMVTVTAEPRYEMWGLVWDRPERWVGLPPGAAQSGGTASWNAAADASITIQYGRDLTYLVAAGAAALSIPVIVIARRRIPGLGSR